MEELADRPYVRGGSAVKELGVDRMGGDSWREGYLQRVASEGGADKVTLRAEN